MRIADIFTNGGYSKALDERDTMANALLGSSGYSKAQTDAIRFAQNLARGKAAEMQGRSMTENMPLGQRIAMAAQAQEVPQADASQMFHSLDKAGVKSAENRIAQQQANAMNTQARVGGALESGANALANGMKAGIGYYNNGQAKRQAVQSMKENEGKNGMPSNLPPLQRG